MKLKEALAKLKSDSCSSALYLNLSGNEFGEGDVKALTDVLVSGKCPAGLELNLISCKIDKYGARALADALKTGRCPQGLKLNLYGNFMDYEGAQALAEALISGQCPFGLQLIFGRNRFFNKGAQALADALNSGKCRFGTTIYLRKSNHNFTELSEENDRKIQKSTSLILATLIGGFSQSNNRINTLPLSSLPLELIDLIAQFLPGHISAFKIAAYLNKSFVNLMQKNREFLQKHRSNNPVNQHLYDKQYGLSLWLCSEDSCSPNVNNDSILSEMVMPIHSIK